MPKTPICSFCQSKTGTSAFSYISSSVVCDIHHIGMSAAVCETNMPRLVSLLVFGPSFTFMRQHSICKVKSQP